MPAKSTRTNIIDLSLSELQIVYNALLTQRTVVSYNLRVKPNSEEKDVLKAINKLLKRMSKVV